MKLVNSTHRCHLEWCCIPCVSHIFAILEGKELNPAAMNEVNEPVQLFMRESSVMNEFCNLEVDMSAKQLPGHRICFWNCWWGTGTTSIVFEVVHFGGDTTTGVAFHFDIVNVVLGCRWCCSRWWRIACIDMSWKHDDTKKWQKHTIRIGLSHISIMLVVYLVIEIEIITLWAIVDSWCQCMAGQCWQLRTNESDGWWDVEPLTDRWTPANTLPWCACSRSTIN